MENQARTSLAARRQQRAELAVAHLRTADRRLARIIASIGPHRLIITRDPFAALAGSIVQQQISMSAAAAIKRRLRDACGGAVKPASILKLKPAELRAVGLSGQKSAYLRDLSEHFAGGVLSSRKLRSMSDEEVIEATTAVKGIGRWTAEMLLMFCLDRADVWPIDDLGIRKAVRNLLGLGEYPDRRTLTELAEPWRPFRSYASWYLWRSLEGPLMPGVAISSSE